ncbi:MAG TPA: hypothetical protein VMH28_02020 [Candidatus Acidoferrales bacterium]|nr:hypothetical protein [Candidatus Acidoferrales bacterium]
MKQARAAFSMLSADEVLERAEKPVTIGLVADSSHAYAEMEDFLVPERTPRKVWRARMNQVFRANDPDVPVNVDLILYEPGLACPSEAFTYQRGDPDATIAEILHEKRDLALPLARQYPAFRPPVINHIIHEVAKENALFALATSLPNVVPNFLELPWIFGEFASDTVFLTANQVRMAFQVAAAAGRNVGFVQQKGELLAIGAGAFGWRAIARELVSHIPLGGGLIPKAAIAYAGTFVVGKGLEFYEYGSRQPSTEDRKRLYEEGLEHGRSFAQRQPAAQLRG